MHVVIVGAGVAGLASALALARDGHRVTILERDDTPMPATPSEAFAHWDRRGAPQVRHSHAFLARLRNLLLERAPDVLAALFAAGATELRFADNLPPTLTDLTPQPGDDELVALACRRTTFEWVLRRCVLGEAGVALRHGVTAVGLAAERSRPPVVTGVHVQGAGRTDATITADLVVDARGPRSSSDAWLRAIGAGRVPEELHLSGIAYLSRFYRLRDGAEFPPAGGPIGGDLGYLKYAVMLGDDRTFSVTVACDVDDDELRGPLRRAGAFEAAAQTLAATAPWREPGRADPITRVHVMAGLRNRYRPFVVGGEPLVLGFLPVGDAAVCTNPLYGRGCSLAVVHAFGLADVVAAHGSDLAAVAAAFADHTERELVPWFRGAVMQDEQARAFAAGEALDPDDPRTFLREVFRDGLLPAVRTSPVVYRAFLRWFNLLATPDALMSDPDVVGEVLRVYGDRDNRPPEPTLGPTRTELLAHMRR